MWNGQKPSEETRLKMSNAQKGRKQSEATKQRIRLTQTGKRASDATLQKMSVAHKGNKHALGIKHSEASKQKRSRRMIDNPNKKFSNNKLEQKIAAELVARGFVKNADFYQNIGLCRVANVDFYLPAYRIVIQADGCYYHNCPLHFPVAYVERRERDAKQDAVLTFNGFNVYRFWEHEINTSVEECIDSINSLNK